MLLPSKVASRRRLALLFTTFVTFLALYFFSTAERRELTYTQWNQLPYNLGERVRQFDWKDSEDEIFCRGPHEAVGTKEPIPNNVHFILLSRENDPTDLSFVQFLAIKSAVVRMRATEVKIHTYDFNKSNKWWRELRDHVTLVYHERDGLHGPNNKAINTYRLEHQSDFLRLDILKREGGIYLDSDVFGLKPFTDLLDSPRDVLLGHEGGNRYGLCNAVIIARTESEFLNVWWDTYKSFNPSGWGEHSVRTPKRLAIKHPDLICPLSPTVFFWPTWAQTHLRYMHGVTSGIEREYTEANITRFGGSMYENQLAYHAWSGESSAFLSKITPESLFEEDTRFNMLVRDVYSADL